MAAKVLNISWNESNSEGLFLPDLADFMKEKEKIQNPDPLEFPVCFIVELVFNIIQNSFI